MPAPKSDSALEAEVTGETTTFEHFGREWTIPTQRHLSHLRHMRDELREGFASQALIMAETFLNEQQFDALLDIDPDEAALTEFAREIGSRLGFGGSGNSSSS